MLQQKQKHLLNIHVTHAPVLWFTGEKKVTAN